MPRLLAVTPRLYPPDRSGGAQHSMDALLRAAHAAGWRVDLVAKVRGDSPREFAGRVLHRASQGRCSGWPDRVNGYRVWRAAGWHQPALVAQRSRAARPDVVLCDHLDAARWCPVDRPLVVRVTDVSFEWSDAPLPQHPDLHLVANSQFIAQRIAMRHGERETTVLYPQVLPHAVLAPRPEPRFVTFVNPVPDKGDEVAFGVAAALPEVAFLFVEGWTVSDARAAAVRARCAALPNVTLQPWTARMVDVYARTRVLLVPSQLEEAFGRVAVEAALNGIPVVASAIGGLPEAVGTGGVLLPADAPTAAWAAAVHELVEDPEAWRRLSAAARRHAARPELDPAATGARFVALLERLRGGRAASDGR